ncbi:MAG: hypothetical protein QNJ20_16575 [Paracoccaceae bacterium]|nr:hypothetical protein [Paracoccaceae bacterium]
MDTLIASIIIWLSANFGLPETAHHPTIKLVSPHDLIEARAAILDTEEEKAKLRAVLGRDDDTHGIVALYDDTSQTIYLPMGWSAASPVDVSILVHEIVHHLQNVGGIEYPCEEGREYPAYQAQQMWLQDVGTDLEREFEIDAMTLLVLTKCWFGPP